jgi:hypothetical protein
VPQPTTLLHAHWKLEDTLDINSKTFIDDVETFCDICISYTLLWEESFSEKFYMRIHGEFTWAEFEKLQKIVQILNRE